MIDRYKHLLCEERWIRNERTGLLNFVFSVDNLEIESLATKKKIRRVYGEFQELVDYPSQWCVRTFNFSDFKKSVLSALKKEYRFDLKKKLSVRDRARKKLLDDFMSFVHEKERDVEPDRKTFFVFSFPDYKFTERAKSFGDYLLGDGKKKSIVSLMKKMGLNPDLLVGSKLKRFFNSFFLDFVFMKDNFVFIEDFIKEFEGVVNFEEKKSVLSKEMVKRKLSNQDLLGFFDLNFRLRVEEKYLVLNNKYYGFLATLGFPSKLSYEFLNNFFKQQGDFSIILHTDEGDKEGVIKEAKEKLNSSVNRLLEELEDSDDPSQEMIERSKEDEIFLNKINNPSEKMRRVALYFSLVAESKEKLEKLSDELEKTINNSVIAKRVYDNLEEAFLSSLPFSDDHLCFLKNTLNSALIAYIPFLLKYDKYTVKSKETEEAKKKRESLARVKALIGGGDN